MSKDLNNQERQTWSRKIWKFNRHFSGKKKKIDTQTHMIQLWTRGLITIFNAYPRSMKDTSHTQRTVQHIPIPYVCDLLVVVALADHIVTCVAVCVSRAGIACAPTSPHLAVFLWFPLLLFLISSFSLTMYSISLCYSLTLLQILLLLYSRCSISVVR